MNTKQPDRLNISKKAKQVVDNIDNTALLNLNNDFTSRSELFLFALALGAEIDTETELANNVGFVLDSSIDTRTKAVIYAVYLCSVDDKETLDALVTKKEVYIKAQSYANTGFEILEDYSSKKTETVVWELIDQLDEQYDKLEIKTK